MLRGAAGLSSRMDDLNGKAIGLFVDFMVVSDCMAYAVEDALWQRYPGASFSHIVYARDPIRITDDPEFQPEFLDWIAEVDCVIAFYGSVPSSSLFLGYNCAYMEKLGKPTTMLVVPRTYPAGIRGVRACGVSGLRTVQYDVTVDKVSGHGVTCEGRRRVEAPETAPHLLAAHPLSQELAGMRRLPPHPKPLLAAG